MMSTDTFIIVQIASYAVLIAIAANAVLWLVHHVAFSWFSLATVDSYAAIQVALSELGDQLEDVQRTLDGSAAIHDLVDTFERRLDRVESGFRQQRTPEEETDEPVTEIDQPSWHFDPYRGPIYERRRVGPVRHL